MESNTSTSHANSRAKVRSHYWGYRELTADEVSAVAGGDRGDYGDGGDRGYGAGDTSSASSNSAGCESPGATAARAEGYAACEATAAGLKDASKAVGNWASNVLAAQLEAACKKGIDNQVAAAWKTANYEFCNGTTVASNWGWGGDGSGGDR